jgi:AbrB family looped-hinge helix DNA binding protein
MTLKMDKAGRVVLPKPLRDRLGLRDGSDLEVEETAEGIVLKPLEDRPAMIKRGVTPPLVKYCTLRNGARFAGPEGARFAVAEPRVLAPVVVAS